MVIALSVAITDGVASEEGLRGVRAASDDIGRKRAARTPRRTPRRIKAKPTRRVRPNEEEGSRLFAVGSGRLGGDSGGIGGVVCRLGSVGDVVQEDGGVTIRGEFAGGISKEVGKGVIGDVSGAAV